MRASHNDGPLAQLVEQFPFKEWVAGSSPARLTIVSRPVVQLDRTSVCGTEGHRFESCRVYQYFCIHINMKTKVTFTVKEPQVCICVCNGIQIHQNFIDQENTDLEFEINNLQEHNHLRLYFLNNKGTVTFDNFVVDGLDFKKTTHSLFTHHITSACAIDQDGSASDDSVYPGHVLNGAGYFKLKFDTPIDNWFFKTWTKYL